MKTAKRFIYCAWASILGIAYSTLSSVDINTQLFMTFYDVINLQCLLISIFLFPLLLYIWSILSHCGETGRKLKVKILILLLLPIFINIVSSSLKYYGFKQISGILYYIRFVIPMFLIFIESIRRLVVQEPANFLLYLSGFAERYKD